jgi:hypothetical protein
MNSIACSLVVMALRGEGVEKAEAKDRVAITTIPFRDNIVVMVRSVEK